MFRKSFCHTRLRFHYAYKIVIRLFVYSLINPNGKERVGQRITRISRFQTPTTHEYQNQTNIFVVVVLFDVGAANYLLI